MRQQLALGLMLALSLLAAPSRAEDRTAATPSDSALERLTRLQGSASLGRNRKVAGATVLVHGIGDVGSVFVTASDSRGLFAVDGLPDGKYRVELRREGLETVVKESIDLQFPARPVVEVVMTPRSSPVVPVARSAAPTEEVAEVRLSGRVDVRRGGVLSGAELRLRRLDGSHDPVSCRSGEDGSFLLPGIAVGDWQLEARVAGFLPIRTPLTLSGDLELKLSLVTQGAGYKPSPYELMPREQVVPPETR